MKYRNLTRISCTTALLCQICILIAPAQTAASEPARVIKHVPVYDIDGRFGGWPANHGMWIWENEILVGFSAGYYKYLGPDRHAIDRDKPEYHLLARSLDGGKTWKHENPATQGTLIGTEKMRHGKVPREFSEGEPIACPGGINFTHPDFAMTLRMSDIHSGASRFYYSYDRGKSWKGPFQLPLLGQKGIAARTDYIVNGKHDCMLFLTCSKSNNREGRVLCARTIDGGKTWNFASYIGPEPAGFSIMPSTVRLSDAELLTTVRRREGPKRFIDSYHSSDNGKSWQYLNRPVPDAGEGNPPMLNKLQDGRICLTYGVRAEPFRIEARMSSDGGKTWDAPSVIRNDGGGRDIGYVRTVQRPDGNLVTVYYFYDKTDVDRKIIATIWNPGKP